MKTLKKRFKEFVKNTLLEIEMVDKLKKNNNSNDLLEVKDNKNKELIKTIYEGMGMFALDNDRVGGTDYLKKIVTQLHGEAAFDEFLGDIDEMAELDEKFYWFNMGLYTGTIITRLQGK